MKKTTDLRRTRQQVWYVSALILSSGLLLSLLHRTEIADCLVGVGLLLSGLSVAAPRLFVPFTIMGTMGKNKLLHALFILVLFLVFACLVIPLALIKRLAGKDALSRSFDPHCETYRTYRATDRATDIDCCSPDLRKK